MILENDPLKREFERALVWFSCGITSAVAAKMSVKKYSDKLPVDIVYTDPGSEHPDNVRFLKDCEKWFGQKIVVLKNPRYDDTWEVFRKERYLSGVNGAKCTTVLKKILRQRYQRVESDIQIFGFDSAEQKRADNWRHNNPEVFLETPLIDMGLTKSDCINIVRKQGIEIPEMYKLGYKNNNCIGCVKGQGGYWNKIRVDFPDVFKRMADVEIELDAAICKSYAGDGKRKKLFLKDLPKDFGNYSKEPDISCGLLCEMVSQDINT